MCCRFDVSHFKQWEGHKSWNGKQNEMWSNFGRLRDIHPYDMRLKHKICIFCWSIHLPDAMYSMNWMLCVTTSTADYHLCSNRTLIWGFDFVASNFRFFSLFHFLPLAHSIHHRNVNSLQNYFSLKFQNVSIQNCRRSPKHGEIEREASTAIHCLMSCSRRKLFIF